MAETIVPDLPSDRVVESTRLAEARDEEPVFFDAGPHCLFGIVTHPTSNPLNVGVILLSGGGAALSTNRNRLWVTFARRLAMLGYHTIRFDYHGVGESQGPLEGFRLDLPFTDDVVGAVRVLQRAGANRFVLIGTCFGARTALASAADVPGLLGVALIAAPIRDFRMGERRTTGLPLRLSLLEYARRAMQPHVLRGLFRRGARRRYARLARAKLATLVRPTSRDGAPKRHPDAWASQAVVEQSSDVLSRGGRLLFLYGEAEDLWEEFQEASRTSLGKTLRGHGEKAEVYVLEGPLHGLPRVSTQLATLDKLEAWIGEMTSGPSGVGRDLADEHI
jgi:pimeloyl-ACP methyl ester carboxylesterase